MREKFGFATLGVAVMLGIVISASTVAVAGTVTYLDAVEGSAGNTFATGGSLGDTSWLNPDTGSGDAHSGMVPERQPLRGRRKVERAVAGILAGVQNVGAFPLPHLQGFVFRIYKPCFTGSTLLYTSLLKLAQRAGMRVSAS